MSRTVVVDASALAAIVFDEPGAHAMAAQLNGAVIFAPTHQRYELASVAWQKATRHPKDARKIFKALRSVLDNSWNISWEKVDLTDAALIGYSIGVSPYDAAYLWLAGVLEAELVTLDKQLLQASAALSEENGSR